MIDAFADAAFRGNPACVVEPFDIWPDDEFLTKLAMENNQAETAYLLRMDGADRFKLRWFTPVCEVLLCGHATLASAHMLFHELGCDAGVLFFETLSGTLTVERGEGGRLEMDFPAYTPQAIAISDEVRQVLGVTPVALYGGPATIALLDSEQTVRDCVPDLSKLTDHGAAVYAERHVIITALADAGKPYEVVSRFFAPGIGIDEDPATGSMHCMLPAIYRTLTGRTKLDYYQAHPRRGAHIQAELIGDRVKLRGEAVTVAKSELYL